MLEFYAGLLTGVVIMLFWLASRKEIVAVHTKDLTLAYDEQTYYMVKLEERLRHND
jgi:hypothetical protein